MTRRAFEQLVHDGASRIPAHFRHHLDDISVIVEDEPTAAQKRQAGVTASHELLGLYHGTPHTERAYLPYRLPDTITVFQGPLERVCGGDSERIREAVAHTVWHELAHALGMSERRIRDVERKRKTRAGEDP